MRETVGAIELITAATVGLGGLVAAPASGQVAGPESERTGAKAPIACRLTSAEQRQRGALARAALRPALLAAEEREDGYALRFRRDRGVLEKLAELVSLEAECCPFLDFELRVRAGARDVELALTGPAGTKGVLAPFVDAISSGE